MAGGYRSFQRSEIEIADYYPLFTGHPGAG